MSCVIIIPARLESTRLPRKLLLDDTGLPLICHTVRTAVDALNKSKGLIAEVVVAADDKSILEAVNTFCASENLPARGIMTRKDHPSGSDRIAEVVATLPGDVDSVINLQGDEPEMEPDYIIQLGGLLARSLSNGSMPDIATLVHPIHEAADFSNPNLVKCVFGTEGRALYFSRSPIPCDRDRAKAAGDVLGYGHMGIYAYKRDSLMKFISLPQGELEKTEKLEQLRALENGMSIAVGAIDGPPPKGIDTREDYEAFVARTR
ncbi:MAG: 3-deoxy-manno-octulosonate cytidylyltransferase [Planctomycetes bacterium]|nr:3-deoxy-manno-octulosonate cytidylyltransferase [Planctomycetota bacterium]